MQANTDQKNPDTDTFNALSCAVIIINYEQISLIVLMFPLWILNKEMPVGKNN